MIIVKTWKVVETRTGFHARPGLVMRFRWRWVARLWAGIVSEWWAISTVHDEADRSNVVEFRRSA